MVILLRRRSVFVTIIVSYLFILIVPTLAGGAGYRILESTLVRNVNRANFGMLEQVQQLVDSRIQEVSRISLQLSLNPNVTWLLHNGDRSHGDAQLHAVALMKEMGSLINVSTFIDSLFLYFRDRQTILTPTLQSEPKLYFKRIQSFPQLDMAQVLAKPQSQSFTLQELSENDTAQKVLAYMQSLPLDEGISPKGAIVILIQERKVLELLQRIDWEGQSTNFILDRSGQVLVAAGERARAAQSVLGELTADSGSFAWDEQGDNLLVSYTTGENGWKYVTAVPNDIVMKPIQRVQTLFLLLLLLGVAAGLAIACVMAYRNYRPIHDMLRTIQKRHALSGLEKRNEYEVINSTLLQAFEEEQTLKKTLEKQAPLIQSNFIGRLIKGNVDIASLDQAALDFMRVSLDQRAYRVILLQIEDGTERMLAGSEQELTLVRFILTNLSIERLQGRGYVVELERDRLAMLEFPGEESGPGKDDWIQELKGQAEAQLQLRLTVAVGLVQEKPEHIWRSYLDALVALERRTIIGGEALVVYAPSSSKGPLFHYPIEFEVQLMNYAKTGDYISAEHVLTQVYEANFTANASMTPEMTRFLFMELLGSLLKARCTLVPAEEIPAAMADPVAFFARYPTAPEMLNQVKHLLHELCLAAKESRTDTNERLYAGIRSFVAANYQDGNLSLVMIADHFGLTPQYLSAFYKKYSQTNLSDYIAEYRVERAKAMLAERELTVGEISRRVGYSNHIGFGRVFKKLEGITPGQYRELHQSSMPEA